MPKISSTSETGLERSELSGREKSKLSQAFDKSLEDTRTSDTQVLVEKIQEYRDEIEVAAEVAKYSLSGELDGQSPESGNFGLDTIFPGYFGYNDWDSLGTVVGGEEFDWLDSHTPDNLNSGAAGTSFTDPLGVGNSAVHVIVGIGTYSPSSATTRVRFELNDQPQPSVTTEDAFRNTDIQTKWLDAPYLVRPDDNLAARGFAGGVTGETYQEALYPVGVSFIEARKLRLLDPADMAGTDEANIVVQR